VVAVSFELPDRVRGFETHIASLTNVVFSGHWLTGHVKRKGSVPRASVLWEIDVV